MSLNLDMGAGGNAVESGGEPAASGARSAWSRMLFQNLIAVTGTAISVMVASSVAVLIYIG